MTYEKLKRVGTKVHEDDFYEEGIYLFTVSYWVLNGELYRHDEHSNQLKYTGETKTEKCSESETKYYLSQFPEKKAQKCQELFDEYNKKKNSIKEHRQAAGLTQEQFSALFNPPIPIDTIKKWDRGKMKPTDWAEGLIIEKLKAMQDKKRE